MIPLSPGMTTPWQPEVHIQLFEVEGNKELEWDVKEEAQFW
jgi:hypothetical protein